MRGGSLHSRARVIATAVAVAALTATLAGCAVGGGDPAPAPLPDGLTVEFVQLRSDVASRQGQVQVHNGTDAPVEIGAVTVTDPRFAGGAERVTEGRSSTLQPGGTVDIRIQLPEMACGVDEGAMTVQLGPPLDDEDASVTGPLPDPLDVIGPLHERECLARQVSDAATVVFTDFTPSPAGEPADLTLTITPTGDGAVRIDGIQTTNLLTFGQDAGQTDDTFAIGVEVSADDVEATVVHLPLVPLRCDPHAVQEDKRGTIFDLDVTLDGEQNEIELAASEDMRGQILTWVADWCGFGG